MPLRDAGDFFPIGIALLILVALPSWVCVAYCLIRSPQKIRLAYALCLDRQKRLGLYWAYLATTGVVGIMIAVAAALVICAGAGNVSARQLLTLM